MTVAGEPFLGTWVLDPKKTKFEFGVAPRSATYRIERDGQALVFSGEWVGVDGEPGTLYYRGIPDGKQYPFEDPEVADAVSIARTSARVLETTAWRDGGIVAHASRTVSEDGDTMAILQSAYTPDGQWLSNLSVYRRVHAPDEPELP